MSLPQRRAYDAFEPEPEPDLDAVEAIIVDAVVVDALVVEALAVDVAELEPAADPNLDAPDREGRHLRVAPDSVRRRRHVRIAAASAALTISATLFAVVGFNVELAQHQIQLQNLQHRLQTEQTNYYNLRSEVAQRSSPQNIVAEATARGLTKAPLTYLTAGIKPPPVDATGTAVLLGEVNKQLRGSLEPVQ